MTRQLAIVAGLVTLLLAVGFYFLVWSPKSDEIVSLEEERANVEQQTRQLEQRIVELEQVRVVAPEIEAAIVASESIVPRELAQPAAVRQLQTASDDAGTTLTQITFARPVQVPEAEAGLSSIELTLAVEGGYYQLVDFLRRVEDPTITPRGVVWRLMTVSSDEYPSLVATVSGNLFALLPTAPEEDEPTPDQEPDPGETPADDGTEPGDGGGLPTTPPAVDEGAQ